MRSSGDILLISCYELGHQPFHLASLQTMLRQAGYFPVPVDTAVETLTDETVKKARFVGVSVPMHTALRLGQQLAKRVRSLNPSAHICFYGLYASLNADYLLQDCADSTIGGEYEIPLLNLIANLESDKATSIPGVSIREQISNPWIQHTAFVVPERNQLPPPDRYARLGHITFGDPDFFNGPTHAMRITRALHAEFPNVTFDATIKIEHLLKHRHLLPELRDLGCAFIVSAVESINDDVLRHLDKGHTSAQVAETFDLMEQVGISLRPSLMPFSPWETLESYIALLTFFEENKLIEHIDPVHFSIRLLIPPGSALLDTPDIQEWLGELDAAAYTYRWTHPDPRMDNLHQALSTLVEQAQGMQADPIETFFHIKALALATNDQEMCVSCAIQGYGTRKVLPHLTESWFC